MSAPASTAPMNFSVQGEQQRITAILPDAETAAPRRDGGQRDEDPSSQRSDPAFKRYFLPHSPPSLSLDFGQGRTTRCRGLDPWTLVAGGTARINKE